ncbi:MAG: LuxR C-terminal-related transcriptional regulator [Planctomycetota bacterium]
MFQSPITSIEYDDRSTGMVAIVNVDSEQLPRISEAAELAGAVHAVCDGVEACLTKIDKASVACIVADAKIACGPEPNLFTRLEQAGIDVPVITTRANADQAGCRKPWRVLSVDAQLDRVTVSIREAIEESRRRRLDRAAVESFYEAIERLSADEHAVMKAVCDGKLNKQIAREFGVSIRTVEQRRRRVFAKMEVTSAVPLASRVATVKTIERLRPRLRRRLFDQQHH